MNTIYETIVTKIGAKVQDFYSEKIVILFGDNVPDELIEYCVLHNSKIDKAHIDYKNIEVGDILKINEEKFKITAVGELVNVNLKNLGHITIKFDGSTIAELPGTLHVENKNIPIINVGDAIVIVRE
ncbi:MAG: PTS glucitol/sorbitol transporter subunit IIA [Thermoanaerobacter sp.]|jgi:PTS system glucitol/sorbitol-specific IIA component|uniref:PTS glucitol/sorbitol transporter subunit IIA n=1 Tax=Thermoanaerobacter sp. TaxID=1755 RepID=UPI001A022656|nr:PTS glucitol/sorbitol transporter subunit IIA [Thermoanaerobacter sp.]